MNSKNSTALITGGAKRIGREVAINLAKMGFDIVISYNKSKTQALELSEEISKKFKVRCEIFACDLANLDETKKLAEFMSKNFSNWNLLINNASIFKQSKFIDDDSQMLENMNIHLMSPLILAKAFAKNSSQNAQIINMVDKNIARYETRYFHYLLSKKFLAETTKMLALQLAPEIRVNAVAPGFILNAVDDSDTDELAQKIIKKIPLQSKGEVENIWQTIEFLINNKFVNGQIIFVDGGASLNHAG